MSPLDSILPDDDLWIDPPTGIFQSVATHVIAIISRMSSVRRQMRLLAETEGRDDILISEIITIAQNIDAKLVQWSRSVPAHWEPRTTQNVSKYIREAGMYGESCLVYSNFWAANTWNRYRTVRIALQTIIMQYTSPVSAPMDEVLGIAHDAQMVIQLECDALRATVPFYLGSRDTDVTITQPVIEFPQCDDFRMSEETRQQLIIYGEWYLFWPLSRMVQNLEVLSQIGYLHIPEAQYQWARIQVVRCGARAQKGSPLAEQV